MSLAVSASRSRHPQAQLAKKGLKNITVIIHNIPFLLPRLLFPTQAFSSELPSWLVVSSLCLPQPLQHGSASELHS